MILKALINFKICKKITEYKKLLFFTGGLPLEPQENFYLFSYCVSYCFILHTVLEKLTDLSKIQRLENHSKFFNSYENNIKPDAVVVTPRVTK